MLLRVLQASLAASRSQLSRHQLVTAAADCRVSEAEREELRTALVAAQDSCVLQILLEACLESQEDRVSIRQLSFYEPKKDKSLNASSNTNHW